MIPLIPRQLFYIAQEQSFAAIARGTGIPYRTILALRKPGVTITSAMKKGLRNMFQRTAYNRLRRTGFSSFEARRWSWFRPERVTIKDLSMKAKIATLTTGAVAGKLEAEGIPTTKEAIDELYDDMYKRVKEGVSESIETTEVIMDY